MSSKKWGLSFLILIFSYIAIIASLNYLIDALGIFGRSYYKNISNMRIAKLMYVLKNKEKYNSFIFGSSRGGFINANKLNTNRLTFFNFSYNAGIPREHYLNIQYLVKNNVKINTIILTLDDFSFKNHPQNHYKEFLYPPVENQPTTSLFVRALFKSPSIKKLENCYERKNTYKEIFIKKAGTYSEPENLEEFIQNYPEKHKKNVSKNLGKGHKITYKSIGTSSGLTDIRKIKIFCKKYNINLIVIINPLYKYFYIGSSLDFYKKELSEITDYYDFSGMNSITVNPLYYSDMSHFREIVGDMIIERIYNTNNTNLPEDFGVYVTKDNINEHLMSLEEQKKIF